MGEIEIYWDDLTDDAQERIRRDYPEWLYNLQMAWPICTIYTGEEEE